MREINAMGCQIIPLGKQGENLATRIRFPFVREWKEIFGDGTFQLVHQRKTDSEPYAVILGLDADSVIWDVRNTDVAITGIGKCELIYIVDNVIAKSITFATKTVESLSDVGDEPPEPWESWVEEVLQAGTNAVLAAEDAENSKDAARESADEIEELTVSAHALPVGSEPTVTKTGGDGEPYNLDFGIPDASGGGGTSDHRYLSNRDADNQHPMSAITGLVSAISGKVDKSVQTEKTSAMTQPVGIDGNGKLWALPGSSGQFAIISATYPEGSTCICTKGSTTLQAPDTTGHHLFVVAETGTWTVSCSDEGHPDGVSTSVNVTTIPMSLNVSLKYSDVVYFDNGTENPITGGWRAYGTSSTNPDSGINSKDGGKLTTQAKQPAIDTRYRIGFVTMEAVKITNNTLRFTVTEYSRSSTYLPEIKVVLSNSSTIGNASIVASQDISAAGTVYFDVSDFVGQELYIGTMIYTTKTIDPDKSTVGVLSVSKIETCTEVKVQADWAQTDVSADDYIKNKPFERLGDTLKVENGTLDINIYETENPSGGNTLYIGG